MSSIPLQPITIVATLDCFGADNRTLAQFAAFYIVKKHHEGDLNRLPLPLYSDGVLELRYRLKLCSDLPGKAEVRLFMLGRLPDFELDWNHYPDLSRAFGFEVKSVRNLFKLWVELNPTEPTPLMLDALKKSLIFKKLSQSIGNATELEAWILLKELHDCKTLSEIRQNWNSELNLPTRNPPIVQDRGVSFSLPPLDNTLVRCYL